MKKQRNPNAPCPPPARVAVRPDLLARRCSRSVPLVVALLLMASTVASARTETLRWTHNDPSNVAGFVIHYGQSSGDYTTVLDAPTLEPDAQGIFSFDIDVPDDATIYVALTAYDGAGLGSDYSNEGIRSSGLPEPTPLPTAEPAPEPTPLPTAEPAPEPTPAPNSGLRTETLRWTHNEPSEVAGFVIYYGLSSGDYTENIDVSAPQSDAEGIFSFNIDVPDDATVYIALTAYDFVGEQSVYSNEGVRSPAGSEPTDPAIGKPGTPYVVDVAPEPTVTPVPTDEWTLTVSVSTSGAGPTLTSVVTNGVGPYQFLFDCGNDGNWDPNGVTETSQPTASHTCPAGTNAIKGWVWDKGTDESLYEVVSVGN